MKELLGYMARHHEDLEKTFTDEQKESFEKFQDCWSEYASLSEAWKKTQETILDTEHNIAAIKA